MINDINQLASQFDAQSFANDVASFGVQYVKFTAWHKGMYPLYPSAKMTTWRGTNISASIDLIGQMIDAVRTKGIAVMLYTHPRDGHDMSSVDQNATRKAATRVLPPCSPVWAPKGFRKFLLRAT